VNTCKAKDGSIICDHNDVLARWNEYFNGLLNKDNYQEHTTADGENIQLVGGPTVEKIDPHTIEELEIHIKMLEITKNREKIGLTAELIKQCGTELKNRLYQLIFRIWVDEELPYEWNFRIICPNLEERRPNGL